MTTAPTIHVYGGHHSPWTQSVLLLLEYKNLKYTFNATPDFKSLMHNRCNASFFQMPVLHYNGEPISESVDILRFIHRKHPHPPLRSGDISSVDKANLFRFFLHGVTRTRSGLYPFFHSRSLQKDSPSSWISLFFRPMTAIYFAILITLAQRRVHKIAKAFKHDAETEDVDAYYPRNTHIHGLRYFQGIAAQRLYINVDENALPSLLDFAVLGQCHCVFAGLSNECIPLVHEHFPDSQKLMESMSRFHAKRDAKSTATSVLEKAVFWIGLVLGFPLFLVLALFGIVTRSRLASRIQWQTGLEIVYKSLFCDQMAHCLLTFQRQFVRSLFSFWCINIQIAVFILKNIYFSCICNQMTHFIWRLCANYFVFNS